MMIENISTIHDLEAFFISQRLEGKWGKSIVDIAVFHDCILVSIVPNGREEALAQLMAMLPDKISSDQSSDCKCIVFRDGQKRLPIEWDELDDAEKTAPYALLPLLRDSVLLSDNTDPKTISNDLFKLKSSPDSDPHLTAFFSFKGGVGRTLHLAAVAKYLSGQLESDMKAPKILLVDADTEAPGLTWWAKESLPRLDYSYLDMLASAEYGFDEDIEWASKALKSSIWELGGPNNTCFFMPAFRETFQLFRPPVRPDKIVFNPDNPWIVTDTLIKLGKKLGVKHILVDLRAGLSELSSPLFFDPRIARVLVTTSSYQSIKGTKAALSNLLKFAGLFKEDTRKLFLDYTKVLLSFVPPLDTKEDLVGYIDDEFSEIINAATPIPRDSNSDDAALSALSLSSFFVTSEYDQNLLGLGEAKEAFRAIERSATVQNICALLSPFRTADREQSKTEKTAKSPQNREQDISTLKDKSYKLIVAEQQSDTADFLVTEAYRTLAKSFISRIPSAVIMGAKGSGKTFFYKSLSALETWAKFCDKCGLNASDATDAALIPGVWSKNESAASKDWLYGLTVSKLEKMNFSVTQSGLLSAHETLRNHFSQVQDNVSASVWQDKWFDFFCKLLGLTVETNQDCERIFYEAIKNLKQPLVILIDGLEDIFINWMATNYAGSIEPLRMLLQDISSKLSRMTNNRCALLIFVRKDLAQLAIKQNFAQFESNYKAYELKWSKEEALRLVGWILGESGLSNYRSGKTNEEWNNMDVLQMGEALKPLWGLKLGSDTSNEAYTANWVLSAISDFQGNFQARDMVRLLEAASSNQGNISLSDDRLLSAVAVKNALEKCGQEKVKEIKEEIVSIKDALEKISTAKNAVMPMTDDDIKKLKLQNDVKVLESYGIIIKDEGKKASTNSYYFPEIYRQGLNIGLAKGARPRVVTLMKMAWRKAGKE